MHSHRHGSAHTSVTGWYPRPLKQLALKLVWAALLVAVVAALGSLAKAQQEQVPSGTWASAAGLGALPMGTASAMLPDGRTIVAGGAAASGAFFTDVVIFDPVNGTWSPAGALSTPRKGHAIAALADGRVLIAGGTTAEGVSAGLEIFNPADGTSVDAGVMSSARTGLAAAALADGRVLIAGGTDGTNALATVEIYDPATGSISPAGSMLTPRAGLSATMMLDGRVLLAGGADASGDLASAEIFDPATGGASMSSGVMSMARSGHMAMLLRDNNSVLIAGGTSAGAAVNSAEVYRPWSDGFFGTSSMTDARAGAVGFPMSQDGLAVVASGSGLASAEAYGFATVKTDKADYAPGETVTITGSGWEPNDQITWTLEEVLVPAGGTKDGPFTFTALADANGNFLDATWAPDLKDLGVKFTLTVVGSVSQAQAVFTDDQPAKVEFVTSGLPAGVSVTVTYSYFNPGEKFKTNKANTFKAPGGGGSASQGTEPQSEFIYSFPATITSGGVTYTLTSSSPASGFATGLSDSTTIVTATYSGANADATCTVTGWSGVYDGTPHGASGSCTGVGGVDLSSGLVVDSTTYTNVSGGLVHWTFSYPNYNSQSGDATVTIGQASSAVAVTCTVGAPYTYTGSAQTPCTAEATGVGMSAVDVTSSLIYANNTNAGAATADASWGGDTNHTGNTGSGGFTIGKASSTTVVTFETGPYTYRGTAFTATAHVTGVGSLDAAVTPVTYGGDCANVTVADGCTASATYAGDGNHETSSDTKSITITKAPSTVTVTCAAGAPHTYTGDPQTPCTAEATGAGMSPVNVTASLVYANNTNAGSATATASWGGDGNHTGNTGSGGFTIAKADPICTVTPYDVTYDTFPHTATGSCVGVKGEPLSGLNLSGTTHTIAGDYPDDPWTFIDVTGNYNNKNGTVHDWIHPRAALVNYIGQTIFVTSGTSATTAQVTLTASMQDPTGTALAGATVDFIDSLTGSTMAKGIKVSPVPGSPGTGTANTIVTLSTGQYGSSFYLIRVVLTGNYTNELQADSDKTATVVVMKPAATNETTGGGTFSTLPAAAGAYRGVTGSTNTFDVGMLYNKSRTNLQGKIHLAIPQSDGSVVYVASNAISSMAVKGSTSTIYTKASVYRVSGGVTTTLSGGATLRLDADSVAKTIGFTVLDSKTSQLYYSNNWVLDASTTPNTWRTVMQALFTGGITVK